LVGAIKLIDQKKTKAKQGYPTYKFWTEKSTSEVHFLIQSGISEFHSHQYLLDATSNKEEITQLLQRRK